MPIHLLADSTLPNLDKAFPSPFRVSLYDETQDVSLKLKGQQVLLCRSTLNIDKTLLKDNHLDFVATASSGSDHINKIFLEKNHIQWLDAKGCNAVAVADYVLSCLDFLQKKHVFQGKTAGIVGLGAVWTLVNQRLTALGLSTYCYDPPKALLDPSFESCSFDKLLSCDLICLHANLHNNQPYPSENLFDRDALIRLKPNAALINAARGKIVNEEALLKLRPTIYYCTDVYANEPFINKDIVDFATICTPHIAGHTVEAKQRAVYILSEKLHQLYGLTAPSFHIKKTQNLSPYRPIDETKALKASLSEAFLTRRKAHLRYDL